MADLGYPIGPIDGVFGTLTQQAVYAVQNGGPHPRRRGRPGHPRGTGQRRAPVRPHHHRPGPLGDLYRPKYFNRQGIAVHGYANVPPYPASHGCVRVSLAAMDWLWRTDQLPAGSRSA
jgi:hypothetical protein